MRGLTSRDARAFVGGISLLLAAGSLSEFRNMYVHRIVENASAAYIRIMPGYLARENFHRVSLYVSCCDEHKLTKKK